MNREEPPAWIQLLTVLAATATGIWGLWCTVIAFIGGTMPILGIQTEGSIIGGVLMLFFGEPIVITLGYWASMIVLLPLVLITARKSDR
ncbi:hypothetical protein PV410_43145 [Streptomyces sp. PA03-5A]|nr:hypothetical protein [Streptomyces sp. PA03-5A]